MTHLRRRGSRCVKPEASSKRELADSARGQLAGGSPKALAEGAWRLAGGSSRPLAEGAWRLAEATRALAEGSTGALADGSKGALTATSR